MTRSLSRRFALVYAALAVLRVLIAFTSTSVIHPDEHFQNPEVAAGAVFRYEPELYGSAPLRTWEWRGPTPARSIVPVFGSTGIAFWLVRLLYDTSEPACRTGTLCFTLAELARLADPTGPALFAAERGVMLLLSFCIGKLVSPASVQIVPVLIRHYRCSQIGSSGGPR